MAAEEKRIDLFLRGHDQASGVINKTTRSVVVFGAAARSASAALGTLIAPFVGLYGVMKMFTTGAEFEKSMSKIEALTGETGARLNDLSQIAQRLGRTTVYSAAQAADAMAFFALAGFQTTEIMKAITPTLDMAAAGHLQIAESADIVVKIMRGMGVEAENVGSAVDVLTRAFTTANTDLRQLGDAMKFIGPVARAAGRPLGEMVAAVQMLSNAGLQAELSGTALRNILLHLAAPTPKAEAALRRLGVSVIDTAGNLRPLAEIIDQFNKAMAGMGSGAKLGVLSDVFEKRAATAFSVLIEQGGESLRQFEQNLAGADGTAKRIAATMIDNLIGAFTIFKSAIAGLSIELTTTFADSLRAVIEFSTGAVNAISRFVIFTRPIIQGWHDDMADAFGALTDIWRNFSDEAYIAVTFVRDLFDHLRATLENWGTLVLTGFLNLWLGVSIGWDYAVAYIGRSLSNLWIMFWNLVDGVGKLFLDLGHNITTVFMNVGDNIRRVFSAIFDSLQTRSIQPFKDLSFRAVTEGTRAIGGLEDALLAITKGTTANVTVTESGLTKSLREALQIAQANLEGGLTYSFDRIYRERMEANAAADAKPAKDKTKASSGGPGDGFMAGATKQGIDAILLGNQFLGLAARFKSPEAQIAERNAQANERAADDAGRMASALDTIVNEMRYTPGRTIPGLALGAMA